MLAFSVLTFVLMLFIFVWVYATQFSKESKLDSINSSLSMQQASISEMTVAIANRAKDPTLLNRLEASQKLLRNKQSLLDEMSKLGQFKQQTFSSLFNALATQNTQELWLNKFTVSGSHITLNGALQRAEALPAWLRNLSSTEYFKETQFSQTMMTRNEGELTFSIQSFQATPTELATEVSGE